MKDCCRPHRLTVNERRIKQLEGELKLAEEGLASYAQEITFLRSDLIACQLERDNLIHDVERLTSACSASA